MAVGIQHVVYCRGATVVHIRRGAPHLDQRRHIDRQAFVSPPGRAQLILVQVGVKRSRMTADAARLLKNLLAAPRRIAQRTIDQIGTRNRLETFQIGINGQRVFLRTNGKLDMFKPRAHRYFRIGADAEPGGGWRRVCKQHRLYVLGVAHTVVKQIPVHGIGARVWVAGGTTQPILKTFGRVVEEDLTLANLCETHAGIQLDRRDRDCIQVLYVDAIDGVRVIMGRVGSPPLHRKCPRTVALQRDSFAYARKEGEVVVCIQMDFARCGRGLCLLSRDFFQHGRQVNQAEFMGAGSADDQGSAILGESNGPGIWKSAIHLIQQDGVVQREIGDTDDTERISGDPAAFQLGGGNQKTSHDAGEEYILAIGRDAQPPHSLGTIDQRDGGDGLSLGMDHRHLTCHVIHVGRSIRQQVRHKERGAVRCQVSRHRFMHRRYPSGGLSRDEIDKGNVIVEAIADIERFAVGREIRRHGGMADGNCLFDFPTGCIHHEHSAFHPTAGHVEGGPIRRNHRSRQISWQGNAAHNTTGDYIKDQHLLTGGRGDEKVLPLRVPVQVGWR